MFFPLESGPFAGIELSIPLRGLDYMNRESEQLVHSCVECVCIMAAVERWPDYTVRRSPLGRGRLAAVYREVA